MGYDFCGWASRNGLRCADGRTISKDAFRLNDGKKVPLVWNHQHNSAGDVLGHALLENRDEGVYAYGSFNKTAQGLAAKEAVQHGDVTAMSIWANNLQQVGGDVIHGVIREVSLVLAGANPGAFIESVMAHGEPMDDGEEEGILYTGESIVLAHADNNIEQPKKEEPKKENDVEDKTVKEVFDTLNEDQKKAVAIIVGQAINDAKGDDNEEEEEEEMSHNLFENEENNQAGYLYLSHADQKKILEDAKRMGRLSDAIKYHMEEGGILAHAIDTTGMTVATGSQKYGFNDPDMLFPDYKSLNNPPEWISRNMDWVSTVMSGVHHTPFSRIKSLYANITEEDARARGYIKGNLKKEEFFTTLKRTTDPQTIYKKQKLDRDDIVDITDFDVISWIKAEMRVMLNEEIARAILIGDGRPSDSDDKIQELHIRPIVTDKPLFNTIVKISEGTDDSATAKSIIKEAIRARKNYKGSGNPTLFTTEDYLTEMLLLEDSIGHKLYKTEAELITALRVSKIVTVEPMEGQKVDDLPLIGVIVNLADYNIGTDRGGEIKSFEQFDIDYNQQKYLIETRMSGALIKPYSALTLVLNKTSSGGNATVQTQSTKSSRA